MKQTTLRNHVNHNPADDHNNREPELIEHENAETLSGKKDRWIDPNGVHEVLGPGQTLLEAAETVLGPAIDAYNAKQKRKDRKMTVEDYLKSVDESTRGRPVKAVKRANARAKAEGREQDIRKESGPRTHYEMVFSLGNVKPLRDGSGKVVIDPQTGERVRPNYIPGDVTKQILNDYLAGFQSRNPNLYMYRADYHADEWYRVTSGGKTIPGLSGEWLQGETHAHIAIMAHAGGYQRGPERQLSITRAFEAMGYVDYKGPDGRIVTAWEQWEQAEADVIKEIALQYGYEIVSADDTRESLSADEYAELADLHEAVADARAELVEVESQTADLEDREAAVIEREQKLDDREQGLDYRERDLDARWERLKKASDIYTKQLAEYGDLDAILPVYRKRVKDEEKKADEAATRAIELNRAIKVLEPQHAALVARNKGLLDAMQADIDSKYPEMYEAALKQAVKNANESPRARVARMASEGQAIPEDLQVAKDDFASRFLNGR